MAGALIVSAVLRDELVKNARASGVMATAKEAKEAAEKRFSSAKQPNRSRQKIDTWKRRPGQGLLAER